MYNQSNAKAGDSFGSLSFTGARQVKGELYDTLLKAQKYTLDNLEDDVKARKVLAVVKTTDYPYGAVSTGSLKD